MYVCVCVCVYICLGVYLCVHIEMYVFVCMNYILLQYEYPFAYQPIYLFL